VLVLTPEGRLASFNTAATRLLGIHAEAAGQVFDRVVLEPEELVAICVGAGGREVEITVEPGQPRPVVRDRTAIPTPSERYLSVRVTGIRDGSAGEAGKLVVVRDMTERHDLETERRAAGDMELELASRMGHSTRMEAIGQLAGGVAHDFNNLLTAIRGFAELHLAEHGSDDPRREDIVEIQRAAERAAQLTQGLLAFSRRAEVNPTALDLTEVAGDAVALLSRLVGENIAVRLDADAEVPCVLADRVQIDQVLLNLAANARDAMPAGGVLGVVVKPVTLTRSFVAAHPGARAGGHVLLEVSDTGVGMDEATRRHLFEPFFTTKPRGEGTGLGLASVYGIVKQAGGYIDVETRPGGGSVFRIYLPALVRATPEGRAKPTTGPIRTDGTETVLLVEDDAAVRRFAERVLRRSGYRVSAFSDPGAALEALTADPGSFDALVTDVVMPTMSGPNLADRIGAVRPGLPTLYISGYGAKALLAGAPAQLAKPFSGGALAEAVGVLFGRAASGSIEHAAGPE
jgi:signal transduction histidine kinase